MKPLYAHSTRYAASRPPETGSQVNHPGILGTQPDPPRPSATPPRRGKVREQQFSLWRPILDRGKVGRTLRVSRGLWLLCWFLLFPFLASAQTLMIDQFPYASAREADRAWRAHASSPRVTRAEPGALTFSVPFASDLDRVYWDHDVKLNLSEYDTISLDLTCPQPDALRSLAVYFKSGNGWYIWNRPLRESGRQVVHMMKSDFQTEGAPAGWHRIEAVRLSPWKGSPRNTTLTLHRLYAHNPAILLVRGATLPEGEHPVARRATQRISQWLSDLDLSHTVVEDRELTAARLQRARIVILGFNPTLPSSLHPLLETFVENGGRMMVLYSGDEKLARLLGFRLGAYQAADGPGQWAAMRFSDPDALRVPARVYQNSWNIRPVHPASESARVIAWWEDARGVPTSDPAWTASERAVWMSHILLQGDDENKRALLAGLLAHLEPALWSDIARHAVSRAGKIGPYASLHEAITGIRAPARNAPERKQILQLLKQVEEQEQRMNALYRNRRYPETADIQRALHRNLLEAYARAQRPQRGEWRAVWDHNGTGLFPGDWDRTAALLAEHGINALLVNMLWGGVAHYESDVLPRSATFRMYGDQLEQCIRAARKHGLEVHVWIVCWNLTGAPPEFVARMRAEGRTIVSANSEPMSWLNPAHPENVQLMVNSLKEVVEKYDVDGIHLDYVRYPNRQTCYSDYSRKRFEAWLGRSVARWPADALPGGNHDEAYRRFRVDQINLAVRAVHQQVRKPNPKLKLSAAVWGGYPDVIQSIAQDWAPWLKRGELDFVTPMNYTTDQSRFIHLTRNQMILPGARGRIYPGLGVTASESQLTPDRVIQQINAARELGATGWVLFDLNNTLRAETLPALRLGITR